VGTVQVRELLEGAGGWVAARRVFGEAYERDGVTVIPVVRVAGGGGLGEGPRADGSGPAGEGGGFGLAAKPVGVYVLSGGTVRWKPAIDVDRLVTSTTIVALAVLLTRPWSSRLRPRTGTARGRLSGPRGG
jgi:uncharacterized spore protein YtfJ